MTNEEATTLAKQLIESNGNAAFEVSMPDHDSYNLMRETFATLGHPTGPDGEFNIVKVFAVTASQ